MDCNELLELLGTLACDRCDEIDGDYDHDYPMVWDAEKRMLRCTKRKEHYEDFDTAVRHVDGNDVIEAIRSCFAPVRQEVKEMQTEKEVFETTGVVEAIAQHNSQQYSVKVEGQWYGGFGTCPAQKNVVYVISHTKNGRFRNIKSIREIGELVRQRQRQFGKKARLTLRVAVKNFRVPGRWWRASLKPKEEQGIQSRYREKLKELVDQSLEDAKKLLGDNATAQEVVRLAIFLSDRKAPHVSRIYDQHMKRQVDRLRKAAVDNAKERAEAGGSGA